MKRKRTPTPSSDEDSYPEPSDHSSSNESDSLEEDDQTLEEKKKVDLMAKSQVSISAFPCEVLDHIFSFCSPYDLLSSSRVCKNWQSVINQGKFLKNKLKYVVGDQKSLSGMEEMPSKNPNVTSVKIERVVMMKQLAPCLSETIRDLVLYKVDLTSVQFISLLIPMHNLESLSLQLNYKSRVAFTIRPEANILTHSLRNLKALELFIDLNDEKFCGLFDIVPRTLKTLKILDTLKFSRNYYSQFLSDAVPICQNNFSIHSFLYIFKRNPYHLKHLYLKEVKLVIHPEFTKAQNAQAFFTGLISLDGLELESLKVEFVDADNHNFRTMELGLEPVQDFFQRFSFIRTFSLNKLIWSSDIFPLMVNVTDLSLSQTKFHTLKDLSLIFNLPNLEVLNLEEIKFVPTQNEAYHPCANNLKELTISLSEVPQLGILKLLFDSMYNMFNLRSFKYVTHDFAAHAAKHLVLPQMSNMETLDVNNCRFLESEWFQPFLNVTSLNLYKCGLSPDTFNKLKFDNLKNFSVTENYIKNPTKGIFPMMVRHTKLEMIKVTVDAVQFHFILNEFRKRLSKFGNYRRITILGENSIESFIKDFKNY